MSDGVTGGQPGRPVGQDEYVVDVAAHLGTPVTWGQLAAWLWLATTRRWQPQNEDRHVALPQGLSATGPGPAERHSF